MVSLKVISSYFDVVFNMGGGGGGRNAQSYQASFVYHSFFQRLFAKRRKISKLKLREID